MSHERYLPLTWSLRENLAWRTNIPGTGWSSPIVWEDRVFVTSASPDGTSCHLLCLDASSGKIAWDKELFHQNSPRKLAENSHATPTPVTDGERVSYAHGTPSGLGPREAALIFTDGGMGHAQVEAYELLDLDTRVAARPR